MANSIFHYNNIRYLHLIKLRHECITKKVKRKERNNKRKGKKSIFISYTPN